MNVKTIDNTIQPRYHKDYTFSIDMRDLSLDMYKEIMVFIKDNFHYTAVGKIANSAGICWVLLFKNKLDYHIVKLKFNL